MVLRGGTSIEAWAPMQCSGAAHSTAHSRSLVPHVSHWARLKLSSSHVLLQPSQTFQDTKPQLGSTLELPVTTHSLRQTKILLILQL